MPKKYKYEPNLIEYMGNEELNKTNSFYNSMKKIDEEKNKKIKMMFIFLNNQNTLLILFLRKQIKKIILIIPMI